MPNPESSAITMTGRGPSTRILRNREKKNNTGMENTYSNTPSSCNSFPVGASWLAPIPEKEDTRARPYYNRTTVSRRELENDRFAEDTD